MSNQTQLFENKKERNDFFIAIAVLLFFMWLFYFLGFRGKNNPLQSIMTVDTHLVDTDGDGINDNLDKCPNLAGFGKDGCPIDSDGDGLFDDDDACIYLAGPKDNKGCPKKVSATAEVDTDGDGIIDRKDKCPLITGKGRNGCPEDSDGDGIYDADDLCPKEAGSKANQGCPIMNDSDGDGVADAIDKCPEIPGEAVNQGCPKDADGDGIPDKFDKCPTVAAPRTVDGCPSDQDKDGVLDAVDKCPNRPGPASNNGCPKVELTNDVVDVLDRALEEVQFEFGSSELKASSHKVLDEIASIMKSHKDAKLSINGHTDNVDGKDFNLRLSESRALACKNYLIRSGVRAKRISTKGYGESRPTATNETAEGRAKNRRVEFLLK